MGSVGAGLASIGGSVAHAQELQRQQKLEDIKTEFEKARLGLEQSNIDIAQRQAGIAGLREKREQAQFEEQMRIARQPKFVGYRVVGGRLYQGVQDPNTGEIKTTEVTGADSAQDVQALEGEISSLPADVQPTARALVGPYIMAQDYPAARSALKPVLQRYAQNQLPQPVKVTDTTETHEVETSQGPKLVQFPKHTEERKVLPGRGSQSIAPKQASPKTKSVDQLHDSLGLPKGSKELGMKPPSRAEVAKLIGAVGDADRRLKVMLDAVKNPTAQNDVALLFNHIGMTLSAQRGARITTAEIYRAISAREISQDLWAWWQKIAGSGELLPPEQRRNMLALGIKNREYIWQQQWDASKSEFAADRMPRMDTSLPAIPGVQYLGQDVQTKAGPGRITRINPDGTFEVKYASK